MERRRIGRDLKESKALYNAVVVVVVVVIVVVVVFFVFLLNSLLSRWPMANKT